MPEPRYPTTVDARTIHVETPEGRLEIGDLDTVLDIVGGPAWTIEYDDWERERYDLDTSDEGLTIDVLDTIEAMTLDEGFVETLRAQPGAPPETAEEAVSPRLGLFIGRLMENLEYGVR